MNSNHKRFNDGYKPSTLTTEGYKPKPVTMERGYKPQNGNQPEKSHGSNPGNKPIPPGKE